MLSETLNDANNVVCNMLYVVIIKNLFAKEFP